MRITGGTFRSRILKAPRGRTTRPTPDRVREALFSSLLSQTHLEGMRMLDLYAGTGSLCLEALSRGATHATFVEQSSSALTALHHNIRSLGVAERVQVMHTSAQKGLERLQGSPPFDLIFVDPPYQEVSTGRVHGTVSLVWRGRLLSEQGYLILEHAARDIPPDFHPLTCTASKRYGDTMLSFYRSVPRAPSPGVHLAP